MVLTPFKLEHMIRISDEEFNQAAERALARIPERFRTVLDNVNIAVEDEPTVEDLRNADCQRGGELLGLYQGIPLTQRATNYMGAMPDLITIFRGPLERACDDRGQLEQEIRLTVLHEIGHYFGLDDEQLHARGY